MTDQREEKALIWLKSENEVQRNKRKKPWGQNQFEDHDVSGGLNALVSLLKSDEALSHRLRWALAAALDASGDSALQLIQRHGRKAGRPPSSGSEKMTARIIYEATVRPAKEADAQTKVEKRRLIPATGTKKREATKKEVATEMGETRTTFYRKQKAAKLLIKND